jgi:hypothetical protein
VIRTLRLGQPCSFRSAVVVLPRVASCQENEYDFCFHFEFWWLVLIVSSQSSGTARRYRFTFPQFFRRQKTRQINHLIFADDNGGGRLNKESYQFIFLAPEKHHDESDSHIFTMDVPMLSVRHECELVYTYDNIQNKKNGVPATITTIPYQ